MMSSGCLCGILIFIDLLKTVIKLGVILWTN
jgi:type IV secretory pathway TrbD component